MYEVQPMICKEIVEEHWLEFLGWVKQVAEADEERQKKRQEALKEIEPDAARSLTAKEPDIGRYRYYEVSVQQFWNWYITNKV